MTKIKAINKARNHFGKSVESFYVYQFPKGHWSYATINSPIGESLRISGMIYPDIDCKAQQFEIVNR